MYSLRRTVAVRFSSTIFVALLLIALWAYTGARHILCDALDANLAASAQLESAVLASRLPIAIQPGPADIESFTRTVNRFVAVRSAAAEVVETNSPLAADLPLDSTSFVRALRGDSVWVTQPWLDGDIRSYFAPTPPGSRDQHAVVQVAASLHPLQASTRQVLFLMLGTVLLGTVATALGAGWLAGTSVAPVLEITEQARSIQVGAGRRITAHADVDEFAGLVEVFNDVLARLDRAFEAQRRMISDAGHDLRTPLTAMRGELEVALRGERRSEEYRAVLRSVLEEVDHLTSISESLALLARLEGGELSLQQTEAEVASIVERATRNAQARADGREIVFHPTERDTTTNADAKLLSIAVNQLLDNCLKHTPRGTRVESRVESDEQGVTIVVEDSGPGMAPEVAEHLFEHFYRSDAARSRTGAAGLGLTIAAAIASAHGGHITATRSPLGGLRVTLQIPHTLPTH
jgi:signal transduction histidine kinase